MAAGGTYMNYDQILFPCWGARYTKTPAELANLVTYMDGKAGAEKLISQVLQDPALLQSLASAPKPDAAPDKKE